MCIILTYHRVAERVPNASYDPALFVSANTFEMHINMLCRIFNIVPLEALIQPNQGGRRCAITFDDGWLDNYEMAFPILKKYQVPATIFLPAALIGTRHRFWFENLIKLGKQVDTNGNQQRFITYFRGMVPTWKKLGLRVEHLLDLISVMKHLPADKLDSIMANAYATLNMIPPKERTIMNWEEISEMGEYNITFGAHGLKHYILPTLDSVSKRKEIFDSLDILRQKKIPIERFFSYPNGDWDDETVEIVTQADYLGAVTTKLGYNHARTCQFLLKRISIHEDISNLPSLFWCRIFQAALAGIW
jgi:peptidoglycan/xylan/chitin deacetylase (PgdA/CDA1 family)